MFYVLKSPSKKVIRKLGDARRKWSNNLRWACQSARVSRGRSKAPGAVIEGKGGYRKEGRSENLNRLLSLAMPKPDSLLSARFRSMKKIPAGSQRIAVPEGQLREIAVNGVGEQRDCCQEAAMPEAPTILIADDEPLLTELLEFRLAARGFRTIVASDGREALSRFAEDKPDAIVLDAMMPVHDGFEVLRRIRAGEVNPQTPVIMLTARRGEQDIVGALELGANDYLVKPFLPEELLVRLGRLLK